MYFHLLDVKNKVYLDSLSSWLIPLWMAMAGKFCSISSWARATHRWTDLTKITTLGEIIRKRNADIFPCDVIFSLPQFDG